MAEVKRLIDHATHTRSSDERTRPADFSRGLLQPSHHHRHRHRNCRCGRGSARTLAPSVAVFVGCLSPSVNRSSHFATLFRPIHRSTEDDDDDDDNNEKRGKHRRRATLILRDRGGESPFASSRQGAEVMNGTPAELS